MPEPEDPWSVYFVRTGEGALYAGIALDVERRLEQHISGRGAKALRGRGPLELVWSREIGERGEALRVEAALKRLPKQEKERLVRERWSTRALLAHLG